MTEPMTMIRLEFEELVANELAACDRMLQWLEDDYNSPERIARRERIFKHVEGKNETGTRDRNSLCCG